MPEYQPSTDKVYKKSLIKKFTAIFVVFMALFLIFGGLMLYFFKVEIDKYIINFQKYKVGEEADMVDASIEKLVIDLKSFYVLKDDLIKRDFSLTTTHIYQLFLVNKNIEEVEIINPDGMEALGVSRVGITPKEALKNVQDKDYFKKAKSGDVFIQDIAFENKSAVADIAIPYFENFRLLAVVRAKINFKGFFGDLIPESYLAAGHFQVLSKDGLVIDMPDASYIGKDVSGVSLFKDLKKSNAKEVFGVLCQPCVEGHDFTVIASAKQIKNPLGFYVILESDRDLVYSGFYTIRNMFIGGSVLTIIIFVISILLLNSRIKKYLDVLMKGIDNFHQGKFDEGIILNTGDELEYFADHFNHMASELGRIIGKIKEADVVKYGFIKTVSHQLRTPISSMMWLLETLIGQTAGKFTQEQNDIFKDIYKANKNINQIINDMLLMAEVDDNKVTLDKSTANYDDIIGSVIFEMQEQIRQKNISISYEKSKIPLPLCEGDVKKIKFIFYRFVDNAVKYSEAEKNIIIKSEIKEKELVFSVVDEGIGIPEAEKSRIFTKFYRCSNAYKMLQDASGLSLYIAKYFIEMHGGKIWFDSKEGKGSTFYFSIPVKL